MTWRKRKKPRRAPDGVPYTDLQRPEMCVHSGEEFVYVLTGVVTLWLEVPPLMIYKQYT